MLGLGVSYYACIALQLVYPTYASFKALQTSDSKDDTQWLTYWVVYAFISTIESVGMVVLNWIPLYYELKFAAVLWLIAPQTQGAKFLYEKHIKPFLLKHGGKLDPIFAQTEQALNSKYVGDVAKAVDKYGPTVAEAAYKHAQDHAPKIAAMAQAAAASHLEQKKE